MQSYSFVPFDIVEEGAGDFECDQGYTGFHRFAKQAFGTNVNRYEVYYLSRTLIRARIYYEIQVALRSRAHSQQTFRT